MYWSLPQGSPIFSLTFVTVLCAPSFPNSALPFPSQSLASFLWIYDSTTMSSLTLASFHKMFLSLHASSPLALPCIPSKDVPSPQPALHSTFIFSYCPCIRIISLCSLTFADQSSRLSYKNVSSLWDLPFLDSSPFYASSVDLPDTFS